MDAAQVLVIILGAALAFFLILAIALLVYLIKIARQIRRITETAERAARKFDGIMAIAQKAAAPAVITKVVADLVQRFTDKKRHNDD